LPKDHYEQDTTNPLDDLKAKYALMLENSKANLNPVTGWPLDVACDGMTFTAIYDLAGGGSDVYLAEDPNAPGKYYRDAEHQCGIAPDTAPTTQSQDAFITVATKLWAERNTKRVDDIVNYINANDRYTGDPHIDQARMTTPVLNTYTIMQALLKDETPQTPVENPDPNLSGQQVTSIIDGFHAHLLVWHIYDRGVIYGAINDLEYHLLKEQAERQPRNTLYSAVYNKFTHGDQSEGIAQLLDESRFPSDKACSTDERCVPYLWSTDDAPGDWAACPQEHKTYTCIDWLIAAKIILGDVK